MSSRRHWLFWPWVAWAGLCLAAMELSPGDETIPYHLGYAGLALAAGLDAWSHLRSVLALGSYAVLSGIVLISRAADGSVAWEETTEIPLMCLLMILVIWHMERRNKAVDRATELAEQARAQQQRRERLVRITSHEMRTPLAIAVGYVDLLRHGNSPHDLPEDLEVVREELDRVSMATDRVVRLIQFHEFLPTEQVDLGQLLEVMAQRWAVVADRDWQVDADVGMQDCNQDRIRACLDTLIENAVRYTRPGDVVRLFAHARGNTSLIGVADSGSGFTDCQMESINAPSTDTEARPALLTDARSQTGLGLSLVREIAESHGRRLVAGRSAEGGAEIYTIGPIRVQGAAAPETGSWGWRRSKGASATAPRTTATVSATALVPVPAVLRVAPDEADARGELTHPAGRAVGR